MPRPTATHNVPLAPDRPMSNSRPSFVPPSRGRPFSSHIVSNNPHLAQIQASGSRSSVPLPAGQMPYSRASTPSLGTVPLSHPPNAHIIDEHLNLSLLRRNYNAFSVPALPPSPPPEDVYRPLTEERGEQRIISQELKTTSSGKGKFIRIVEVSPRDGLQNLPPPAVPTEVKRELVERLLAAGVRNLEVGSFVRGDWVPQMADTSELLPLLPSHIGKSLPLPAAPARPASPFAGGSANGSPVSVSPRLENGEASLHPLGDVEAVHYPVLVPNMRGLDNLIKLDNEWQGKGKGKLTDEIAVFVAASEAFSEVNNHSSISKVISALPKVIEKAHAHGYRVRGYVSCVITCPYSGPTDPEQAVDVAERLLNMGCYEVSMGDTTGEGDPESWRVVWELLKRRGLDLDRVAAHCHDTLALALSSIVSLLPLGLRSIDSSLAGLGGCPYSPGATGNVATEDVVYTLHRLGYGTGINLDKLVEAGNWLSETLGVRNESRVGRAIWAKRGRREKQEAKELKEREADTEDGM